MLTFDLPQELIAQEPAQPRDHARLLVYNRATRQIVDDYFYNLPQYLPANTTLVLNNSKVEQCRWLFDAGKTELFVLEKLDTHTIRAMVRPGKRFRLDDQVTLADDITATVLAIDQDGIRTLKLSVPHDSPQLRRFEHIPLPPYIAQNDTLADEYQTVYAKPLGSKAAPTAGLHFTPELLATIARSHPVAEVTLHVGLGTFAKLTPEQLAVGKLHRESYSISPDTAVVLTAASHSTAVGTTSVRTLESALREHASFRHVDHQETDILIQPGYTFHAVGAMITNFHLPATSLLLLVSAFIKHGQPTATNEEAELELLRVYQHAIAERYRFYSFGDAMLIL